MDKELAVILYLESGGQWFTVQVEINDKCQCLRSVL